MTRRVVNRIAGFGPVTKFGESDAPGHKWLFRDKHLVWHDVNDVLPPYQKRDILWVRETFTKAPDGNCLYRSDPMFDDCGKGDISWNWTSPIFMPREAARITLEVKAVRIERVQEITDKDVKAEGCDYIRQFMDLWDTLNAKRGCSWESNPWVYVYGFMRAT
jgi:hypothetical protein